MVVGSTSDLPGTGAYLAGVISSVLVENPWPSTMSVIEGAKATATITAYIPPWSELKPVPPSPRSR